MTVREKFVAGGHIAVVVSGTLFQCCLSQSTHCRAEAVSVELGYSELVSLPSL
jgi:hypothetical protein